MSFRHDSSLQYPNEHQTNFNVVVKNDEAHEISKLII